MYYVIILVLTPLPPAWGHNHYHQMSIDLPPPPSDYVICVRSLTIPFYCSCIYLNSYIMNHHFMYCSFVWVLRWSHCYPPSPEWSITRPRKVIHHSQNGHQPSPEWLTNIPKMVVHHPRYGHPPSKNDHPPSPGQAPMIPKMVPHHSMYGHLTSSGCSPTIKRTVNTIPLKSYQKWDPWDKFGQTRSGARL